MAPLRLASLAFAVLSIPLVWAPPRNTLFAQEEEGTDSDKDKHARPKLTGIEGKASNPVWRAFFIVAGVGHIAFNLFVFQKYGGGWTAFMRQPMRLDDMLALLGMAGSVVLRRWSYATLGRFFTYKVHMFKDHELVTDGPYKRLMHPGYTALILQAITFYYFIGLKHDLRILALYLATGIIPLGNRIRNEEQDMENHFGKDKFRQYRSTRWRIIPFVV